MAKKASLGVPWLKVENHAFFLHLHYFTNIAGQNTVLMTILGLQSLGCFRAERRFNATHGWAPRFDKSRSDFHENNGNQQRLHPLHS